MSRHKKRKKKNMGLFQKLGFKKASTGKKHAQELHGQAIEYVTERRNEEDIVVGRGGSISVRNGDLLLFSSDTILLRADINTLEASYLLSGDGVILEAPNKEENGKIRKYIAYFVYYRK